MNKTDNKKIFFSIAAMCLLCIFSFSSCLSSDDEEVINSPECAITSFSIGSITSYVGAMTSDGRDTVVKRVISGKDIRFNIDQVNGHIYSVDSLTSWADVSKIVPYYSATGGLYYKPVGDAYYRYITSGTDSIDFTNTVEVMCGSYDGKSVRKYTIDIYKSKFVSDSLVWKRYDTALRFEGQGKALYNNGKMSLFYTNADGKAATASSENGTEWSSEKVLSGADGNIDCQSVLIFKNAFYAMDSEGYIYRSAEGTVWQKVSEEKFQRLLAADGIYLYAFDGTAIMGSEDMSTWTVQGAADIDMLPETCVQSFSYPTKTNANINTAVMMGLSSSNSKNSVTWYKLSSKTESANQQWAYIQVTGDNFYGLPYLNNLSAFYYNGSIFAIGTQGDKYKAIYRSQDNGIAWHVAEKYPLPTDLDAANGAAIIASTADGELWTIQANGTVWKGSIH